MRFAFCRRPRWVLTAADLARLKQLGYNNWIEEQFAAPRTSHQDFVISEIGLDGAVGAQITMDPIYRSWWKQALTGNDQLRQRVIFALSQIVVTSAADAPASTNRPAAMASYLDVLSKHAFGNYRDLLDEVSMHPTMGRYLTALGNRADGGRVPDENYAREIMQLFSIGIVQLNNNGTPKLVNNAPVDTYTMDDIRGLAKVFTGWSWGNTGTPNLTDDRFFGNEVDRAGSHPDAALSEVPLARMQDFPRRDDRGRHARPTGDKTATRYDLQSPECRTVPRASA